MRFDMTKLKMKYLVLKLNSKINLFCLINELKKLRMKTNCKEINEITINDIACIILNCINNEKYR